MTSATQAAALAKVEGRAKQSVPPIIKLIAFLASLAAVYELWPTFLWATLGLVVLYLVLANGTKVSEVLGQVPAGFTSLVKPIGGTSGVGRLSGNLKS